MYESAVKYDSSTCIRTVTTCNAGMVWMYINQNQRWDENRWIKEARVRLLMYESFVRTVTEIYEIMYEVVTDVWMQLWE